jgi:formamidopyrimidine-DNA glycosylase
VAYLDALEARVVGRTLVKVRLASPFLLRTVDPPLAEFEGRRVAGLARVGKRIAFDVGGRFLVLHLMIAGRLHWREAGAKIRGKVGIAAFDFETGTLELTEAGSKRRASLHAVRDLKELDPGGIEVLDATLEQFRAALARENHTVKRSLTDPRIFSGIGNSYSDEILHRARLSPLKTTSQLTAEETERLWRATGEVLREWIARLKTDEFPEGVTAFREGMAVHGRFKKPCPVCGAPVQRIRYAENELNYCAGCQTGGRILADRSLSRLLKDDFPRTLEELEERAESRARRVQ